MIYQSGVIDGAKSTIGFRRLQTNFIAARRDLSCMVYEKACAIRVIILVCQISLARKRLIINDYLYFYVSLGTLL